RPEGAAGAASRRAVSSTGASPSPPGASLRPQAGDELELAVESLAFGGEGVARIGDGGYVVFVAGAIPGDRVRAVVHKRKRSYARARTLEVLEPSPERIAPLAEHPGVPWQVLPYERQLEIKRTQVAEARERIGWARGFGRGASERIEAAPDGRARLRNLVVREGRRTGLLQVRIVTTPGDLDAASLAAALCEGLGESLSGVLWTRSHRPAETTAGGDTELVWGQGQLSERLGSLDLRISAEAFLQTNTEMAEQLYEIVA